MLKGRRDSNSLRVAHEERNKLSETNARQEVFWRQHSKQFWLRDGDQKSKFFHLATKQRRKSNQITSLQNSNGDSIEWGAGLEETMIEYFSTLFSATTTEWEEVTACVSTKVTMEQNAFLMAEVEEKEVKAALFSMYPEKSPGPDGMSPDFY